MSETIRVPIWLIIAVWLFFVAWHALLTYQKTRLVRELFTAREKDFPAPRTPRRSDPMPSERERFATLGEDAARYRYLREHHLHIRLERMMSGRDRPCLTLDDCALPDGTKTGYGDAVDAAIDAARATEGHRAMTTPEDPPPGHTDLMIPPEAIATMDLPDTTPPREAIVATVIQHAARAEEGTKR